MAHYQVGLEEVVSVSEKLTVTSNTQEREEDALLRAAHKRSSYHREEILASTSCSCFYCSSTFPPTEIKGWIDKGQTAMCPRCGIDSVIGNASGLLKTGFIEAMHEFWFAWGSRPRTRAEWTAAHDPSHPCVFDLYACECQGSCNCHFERERLKKIG